MTLDNDDIEAIATLVVAKLGESGDDSVKSDIACRILGVGKRALHDIAIEYPEIKPSGRGGHVYSRTACLRVARLRTKNK